MDEKEKNDLNNESLNKKISENDFRNQETEISKQNIKQNEKIDRKDFILDSGKNFVKGAFSLFLISGITQTLFSEDYATEYACCDGNTGYSGEYSEYSGEYSEYSGEYSEYSGEYSEYSGEYSEYSGEYSEYSESSYSSESSPPLPPPQTIPSGEGRGKKDDPTGGDPVNMRTGNYESTVKDFFIPGRILDISFKRSYNSKLSYFGPFGWGWTHSYNHRIYDYDTYVIYFDGEGYLFRFEKTDTGYTSPNKFKGTLTKIISYSSITEYHIVFPNNYVLHFTSSGYLLEIDDYNNYNSVYVYNENGILTGIDDTVSRSLTFEYNSSNLISKITLPDSSYFSYYYTGAAGEELLTSVTSSNGFNASYSYDSNRNMISKSEPGMPTGFGTLNLTYDDQHRVTQLKDVNNILIYSNTYQSYKTIIYDAKSNSTTYDFDTNDNLIRETNPLGYITQYGYDSAGNRTSVIDAKGKTVSMTYDANNNMISFTDQLGKTTYFSYNSYNKVTRIYNDLQTLSQFEYEYSTLTKAIDYYNTATTFTYGLWGLPTLIKYSDESTAAFEYDYYVTGAINKVTLSTGEVYTYENNILGRVTKITDQTGASTTLTYTNDKISKITYPDGVYEDITYTAKGYLKTLSSNGKTTTYNYSNTDYLLNVSLPDSKTIAFSYESNGNIASITDRGGKLISMQYNNDDSVNNINYYSNALKNIYEYDELGRVTKVTDKAGNINTCTYDDAGKLTAINDISFNYDSYTRLSSISSPRGTFGYTYTYNLLTQVSNPDGRTTKYGYSYGTNNIDFNCYLKGIRTINYSGTGGFIIYYGRDSKNRLSEITNFETGAIILTINYDSDNYVDNVVYGNESKQTFTYNKLNKTLTSAILTNSSGTVKQSLSYTYNSDLLLTSETIDGSTKAYNYNSNNELDKYYLNGTITEAYNYDYNGNITLKDNIIAACSYGTILDYNSNNQVVGTYRSYYDEMLGDDDTIALYYYDTNGNLIQKQDVVNNCNWEYIYDKYNRLITVKRDGVIIVQSNTYDDFGRRIRKVTASGTINYFYEGNKVVIETDGNGNVIAQYQGPKWILNGVTYYAITDIRGSILKLIDTNGNVAWDHSFYSPYGDAIQGISRYGFCGCEYDAETGLYYMGARFYDPSIGRFITPDPIGLAGGSNVYQYCHNDPVNFVDPSGLANWKAIGDISWDVFNLMLSIGEMLISFETGAIYLTLDAIMRGLSSIVLIITDIGRIYAGEDSFIEDASQSLRKYIPTNLLGFLGLGVDKLTGKSSEDNLSSKNILQTLGDLIGVVTASKTVLRNVPKILKTIEDAQKIKKAVEKGLILELFYDIYVVFNGVFGVNDDLERLLGKGKDCHGK
jgi:RHS repeat-associated protein